MKETRFFGTAAASLLLAIALTGCEDDFFAEEKVDFDAEGVEVVRQAACAQDWETVARKGAAADQPNASTLWSVSPYQVLIPTTGAGYTKLNVDAPHYDWLIYTTADVELSSLDGQGLELNGPVEECPEQNLVEYGVHPDHRSELPLLLEGEPMSRARFFSGLSATNHSDPNESGHAGHNLAGHPAETGEHGGHHGEGQ